MSEVRDRLGYPDPDSGEECLAASSYASAPVLEDVAPPQEKKENASARAAHSANILTSQAIGEERDWIDDLADGELDGWRPAGRAPGATGA